MFYSHEGMNGRDPSLGDLVAVDQSLTCPGIAIFHNGRLRASTSLPQHTETSTPIAARALIVASHVCTWVREHTVVPRTLVIEWPQIYTAVKSKGDPNDLLSIAGVGAAIAGMLTHAVYQLEQRCLQVLSPRPSEWAGQLPKSTKAKLASQSPRARRVLSKLDDLERQVATLKHDALDAIGIGLYVLGRLDPYRVLPGATCSKSSITTRL